MMRKNDLARKRAMVYLAALACVGTGIYLLARAMNMF